MSDIKYHISCFDTLAKQAWQFSKICRLRIASYNSNICVLSGGLMFFIFVVVIKLANDIPVSKAHEIVVVVVVAVAMLMLLLLSCRILG